MKLLFFTLLYCSQIAFALDENSLYQIGSKWTNQEGKEIELKEFGGRPTLIALVYLTCKYICPTIISEVKDLEVSLSKEARGKIQVILISFDPTRDTPTVMKSYMAKRQLDPNHWTFLTNKNESKIRELAVTLNFKYQKTDDGEFTHSFLIGLLDSQGVLKARIDSANQPKKVLIDEIQKLSNVKP